MAVTTVVAALDLYRFFHSQDDETRALRGVSFSVRAGEFVALLGPSGSGKSTLLACLAGIAVPDGGQVELLGERIARLDERSRSERRSRNIGILMQSRNLISGLNIEENVRLPLMMAGQADGGRVLRLLEALGISARRWAMPGELSGGEPARAGLGVAIVRDPQLTLADEPTAEVDAETEDRLLKVFQGRCDAGAAVIVATHSRHVANAATRIIHLVDGRIVDDSSAR